MDKELLSTTEVAKILNISRQAVLKKIRSGEIKAKKIGENYAIDREDLPVEIGGELTEEKKKIIEKAVRKTVREYGETLKLLGKE
ncbi:MAG: helix-turn-helix domain-containing protein [Candidatus Giovannonibacteria bacterium]|nr:MAG: helix-turn-helix domain-containing protein [Candidatus Giovannonibacteria bacterium]